MMVIIASEINSNNETLKQSIYSQKPIQGSHVLDSKQPSWLQAIIEGLVDGILVLSQQGEWIYANECARQICQQLSPGKTLSNSVPQVIWQVCESLRDRLELLSDQEAIIGNEIKPNNSVNFRVRVRWLVLEDSAHPLILVTIEDQNQARKMQAIADAKKYGLTRRETEVWSLHQSRLSYKEIADRLYITLNTVKKHIKNIYAKQQEFLLTQDE
ncbi:LuxR C-terminal-related transcriptional regulator [Allocoleopsis sp.]|uniref:LuxR C-terminal-related transcriptional regulator n=1 Tax=Allocoleopsis sp. TaxID=3088169 RepID=UPI002FD30FBA